jgi:hypothetical protein
VDPVGGTIVGAASQPQAGRSEPTPARVAQSRALVNVSRPARKEVTHLPGAGFLAQLIACHQKMPQTRERRRAEPQEAAAVYARRFPIAADPAEHTRSFLT